MEGKSTPPIGLIMRYQFQSEHGNHSFRPRYFTEAIKMLVGINVLLFILRSIARGQFDLAQIFGLSSETAWPMVWQPLTYMFIHGDLFHVLINMFVLWMFGSEMESIWGRRPFLKYYFITGIGSGLVWLLFNAGNPNTVLIGASGAIYGILLAYGIMFPNREILLYFLFPIKVKYFVILLGGIAFFSSMGAQSSNISHLTHLSGMVIGYIYLKSPWKWKSLGLWSRNKMINFQIQKKEKETGRKMDMEKKVDRLLDKINRGGYDNLTEEEKDELYQASRYLSKGRDRD